MLTDNIISIESGDYMNAKNYLEQVKLKAAAVKNLEEERANLKDVLYSIGGSNFNERVQSSKDPDRFGNTFGKISKLDEKLNRKIAEYIDFRNTVVEQINDLQNARHVRILYLRYIKFMSWDEIAATEDINMRYAQKLNGRALLDFQKKHADILNNYDKGELKYA